MLDYKKMLKFSADYHAEDLVLQQARENSIELGLQPISAAAGANLNLLSRLIKATTVAEIGTGCGHTTLWLFHNNSNLSITTIDAEAAHHQHARASLQETGLSSKRYRLILGDPVQVLPRLNDADYDLVVINPNPAGILDIFENSIRLVKPGGLIVITNAMNGSKLADPAQRDQLSSDLREILSVTAEKPNIATSLLPIEDGLLLIAIDV